MTSKCAVRLPKPCHAPNTRPRASVNIKRSDNEITIGNPELKPTVSYNFDLSADYYFRSIGLISAGIFYKKIDDFIVDQVSTNYEYQGNTYTRFTQPKNAATPTW